MRRDLLIGVGSTVPLMLAEFFYGQEGALLTFAAYVVFGAGMFVGIGITHRHNRATSGAEAAANGQGHQSFDHEGASGSSVGSILLHQAGLRLGVRP